LKNFNQNIFTTISKFKGRVVNQNRDYFMVSFESVSHAINCAVQVQTDFKDWKVKNKVENIKLKTGMSAGVPVTDKEAVFEDTIKRAERLYYISRAKIVVSNEVSELYQNENQNVAFLKENVTPLSPDDEKLLNDLMDYMEVIWKDSSFNISDLSKELGLSKSNLYRKMITLTGTSPNTFIKEFRLKRALNYIRVKKGNISEIAFETGFGSPSYFTKCFQQKFGLSPSDYLHLIEN
jgi:AraC-like DNA-binding protein